MGYGGEDILSTFGDFYRNEGWKQAQLSLDLPTTVRGIVLKARLTSISTQAAYSGTDQAAYPATLYTPPDYPNLGDPEEQRRLSPPAMRAFLNIMRHWRVRDEDARQLLGGVSNGTFYNWKAGNLKALEHDRLLRISYLIGIFKSLNILFSTELADRWVQLPNTNDLFVAQSPLHYMLRGGAPAMETVRRLLDARRGG